MQRRENIASPAATTGHRLSNGRTPPDRQPTTPSPAAHDARRERLRLEATRKALLLRQCVSGRAKNTLTPRYDLRRRVLETNLVRESKCQTAQQPGDLVLSAAPKPAQPTPPRSFRRWGYCDASNRGDATQARSRLGCRVRALQRSSAPAAEMPRPSARLQLVAKLSPLNPTRCGAKSSPRKLGSPRNFAVVSAAAIKKRLRRSWSYREAIAGDAPTNEKEEAQAPPKRLKTDSLDSPAETAATNTRPVLSKRPCRVQHGKPFAIPTPPAITPATSSPTARSALSPQPQQVTRRAITSHASTATPAPGRCVSFAGTLATPSARVPAAPHATWALTPHCRDRQGGVITPTVTPWRQHLEVIEPLSPSVVSQGTQTSPKRLRRRSSLKRAFERLLSSGKENEANASQQSVPKNAKVKVKRRPSLVESLLFRRSSNDNENQSKPGRRSTDYAGASKNIAGSTPRRNKPRRAHSLQLKAPEFDPWG